MRIVLKPLPVLVACAGCLRGGKLAGEHVAPQRCYMLAGMQPDEAAERIAAEL